MKNKLLIFICTVFFSVTTLFATDPTTVATNFLAALASGDSAQIANFYGASVELQAGSELLNIKFGLYTGAPDTVVDTAIVKDTIVHPDYPNDTSYTIDTLVDTIVNYRSPTPLSVNPSDMISALLTLINNPDEGGLVVWQEWLNGITSTPSNITVSAVVINTSFELTVATGTGDDILFFKFISSDSGNSWQVESELTDY